VGRSPGPPAKAGGYQRCRLKPAVWLKSCLAHHRKRAARYATIRQPQPLLRHSSGYMDRHPLARYNRGCLKSGGREADLARGLAPLRSLAERAGSQIRFRIFADGITGLAPPRRGRLGERLPGRAGNVSCFPDRLVRILPQAGESLLTGPRQPRRRCCIRKIVLIVSKILLPAWQAVQVQGCGCICMAGSCSGVGRYSSWPRFAARQGLASCTIGPQVPPRCARAYMECSSSA